MPRPKATPEQQEAARIRKIEAHRKRRADPEYRAQEQRKQRKARASWSAERREQKNKLQREWYRRQSPEYKSEQARYMHAYGLKRKYGITPEERDALFNAQGRKCACCSKTEPGSRLGWSIDHSHEPPYVVRGILCHDCNIKLGWLGDTPERVRAKTQMYIDYLENRTHG